MSKEHKPRVFMVEPSRVDVDISDASVFGEIVTVFEPPARGPRPRGEAAVAASRHTFRPSVFDCNGFARRFIEMMESLNFDPEVDYFMVTGPMLGTFLAGAALKERYGKLRLLVFNSSENKYLDKDFDELYQATTPS